MTENEWLVIEIIRMFESLGFDDPYIKSKRDELVGRDRLAVLQWCYNLDDRCQSALCERVGILLEDFKVTLEILKKL
jgi:hypothetical protein